MTIDQWEIVTDEDSMGIGKDEGNARGERTRARASSRGCPSTSASPKSRSKEATLRELVTQLEAEREERAPATWISRSSCTIYEPKSQRS